MNEMKKIIVFVCVAFLTASYAEDAKKGKLVEQKEVTAEKKVSKDKKVNEKKTVVKKGDKIKVYYEGTLTDGTMFDKSKEGKPLEFTVGEGRMIKGFDKGVEGMKLNEEKTIKIKADEAYGQRNETLVKEFPRSFVPKDFKMKKEITILLKDQLGRTMPARIVDFDDKSIKMDLNHSLAGKDLIFKVKVISIE